MWKPGIPSPNPTGRPKQYFRDLEALREKFAGRVVDLVEALIVIGLDTSEKAGDRVRALDAALDRLIGKPLQEIEGNVGVGIPPEQLAMLQALAMTPAQRRKRIADLQSAKPSEPVEGDPADGADD